MTFIDQQPFVSVIVPAYDAEQTLETLLSALVQQSYPAGRHEVILVDNGSSDATAAIARQFSPRFAARFIQTSETETQGSYAARNRGLALASGDIIAFTDADCTPASHWLEEGVRALQEQRADLVGGHVRFTYRSRTPNSAELLDSRVNMQIESGIRTRGVAKTANLFVRASLFDEIGWFPPHMKSGGDVLWTERATTHGFKLVFAKEAEVSHPARSWGEVFSKQFRVGRGQVAAMREKGIATPQILGSMFKRTPNSRRKPSGRSAYPSSPAGKRARLLPAYAWAGGAQLLGRLTEVLHVRSSRQ